MNIKICKLTKDMADNYIEYFDNRAFSDGNINKGCYCVWHHWTDKHEHERSLMLDSERPYRKRDYAVKNGYDYVEGYPPLGEFNMNDCGGSVSMYESKGFEIIDVPNGLIARRKLSK